MDLNNHINLFMFNNLAERVGFESAKKRSFNELQVSGWQISREAVQVRANGM